LPYTIKYDPELQHSYNNIINKWLKNVENFIPLSEIDLKNQIKVLINENKDLNLEVTELKKSLSLYTGKYKKYYELVDNISHRVGNNFSDFERKINTLLNGI
jgi:regulator of replication initiation timing